MGPVKYNNNNKTLKSKNLLISTMQEPNQDETSHKSCCHEGDSPPAQGVTEVCFPDVSEGPPAWDLQEETVTGAFWLSFKYHLDFHKT